MNKEIRDVQEMLSKRRDELTERIADMERKVADCKRIIDETTPRIKLMTEHLQDVLEVIVMLGVGDLEVDLEDEDDEEDA